MARAEAAGLTQAAAQYDDNAMQRFEEKRMDIERLQLSLAQMQERQALDLRYAQDSLNSLRAQAVGAEMRAPFDGVITYRVEKDPGDYVEPHLPLLYISDENELIVEYAGAAAMSVSRAYAVKGFVKDRVYDLQRIIMPSQDIMYYSALQLTPPLRFTADDPEGFLEPGMFVSIWVYEPFAGDVLRIPSNALFSDIDLGHYVYVLENGHKGMRQVEAGVRTDTYVEIKNGLQEGDEVFVK
jgi:macrolide-specific efflux system membrane fusion protein